MAQEILTHRQRMEACLTGGTIDRVPIALWRHFPVDDQTPGGLAAATVQFQRTFDFDLVKVTPASSFCLRDWGVEDVWRANPEGTRDYTRHIIHQPEDWENLPILDATRGWMGNQLECLRMITSDLGPDVPVIQTIFSPLAQAKHLAAPGELVVQMRQFPEAFEAGLHRIAEVTGRFIQEAMKTGIAGIFYAVQFAQFGLLSEEEFVRFGKRYDLQLLEGVRDGWLNLLHLHGEHLMFQQALDYPVQILNWHDRQAPPTLSEGQKMLSGVVCGGIRQWDTMVLGIPASVTAEVKDAIDQTGGRRLLVGTGCVVPTIAPYGNILAARRAVADLG